MLNVAASAVSEERNAPAAANWKRSFGEHGATLIDEAASEFGTLQVLKVADNYKDSSFAARAFTFS